MTLEKLGRNKMAIGEYTAAFTSRYSGYVLALIGIALTGGFLYAFNFTTLFGGGVIP